MFLEYWYSHQDHFHLDYLHIRLRQYHTIASHLPEMHHLDLELHLHRYQGLQSNDKSPHHFCHEQKWYNFLQDANLFHLLFHNCCCFHYCNYLVGEQSMCLILYLYVHQKYWLKHHLPDSKNGWMLFEKNQETMQYQGKM